MRLAASIAVVSAEPETGHQSARPTATVAVSARIALRGSGAVGSRRCEIISAPENPKTVILIRFLGCDKSRVGWESLRMTPSLSNSATHRPPTYRHSAS